MSLDVSPKRTYILGPSEADMARAIHKLTARAAETGSEPGRHSDGGGGSVAKTIAEDGRTGINWIRSPLCGGIEKSGNEDCLSSDIASADLSNMPLPNHRHRFETCQCSSGGSEPP